MKLIAVHEVPWAFIEFYLVYWVFVESNGSSLCWWAPEVDNVLGLDYLVLPSCLIRIEFSFICFLLGCFRFTEFQSGEDDLDFDWFQSIETSSFRWVIFFSFLFGCHTPFRPSSDFLTKVPRVSLNFYLLPIFIHCHVFKKVSFSFRSGRLFFFGIFF